MTPFIIGMTEAGDPGLDLNWLNRLNNNLNQWDKPLSNKEYAGAILITKAGHRPQFQEAVKQLKLPCIIHFDCTGWGSTDMEPNVPNYVDMLYSIHKFINNGFPANRCVLRIDPIIPTKEGLDRAAKVVRCAEQMLPDITRIRISIYDDYHKSREEIIRRGYKPVDSITKWKNEQERRPTPEQVQMVAETLITARPKQIFEVCAEPELANAYPDHFIWTGCLSTTDLNLMHIPLPDNISINGQNRYGCRCLTMKQELLDKKMRCPNNCAYCYWGRN